MHKKLLFSLIVCGLTVSPFFVNASITDVLALPSQTTATAVPTSPLNCYDFQKTLKNGSKSYDVRALQYALIKEGMNIPVTDFGIFNDATESAVMSFQQKYAADILQGVGAPTGIVGQMTRAKLNSLYGCSVVNVSATQTSALPSKISIQIKNTELDSNGVTATFCNQSSGDLPVFPIRLRLNGIIRDFNITSVLKAGSCSSESLPYSTWGLTYDPNTTYSLVSGIDPNNMYKTSSLNIPLSATTTLSIPAIAGYHLSIRGVQIKSNGLQATLCNLGDQDVVSYPVRVTINGTSKDLEVTGAYAHGKCQSVTWTYDMWGIYPAVGSSISANINVDPNNIYKESNEFDNAASIVGTI